MRSQERSTGLKIALCNEVLRELPFEAQCELAAALGYDGLAADDDPAVAWAHARDCFAAVVPDVEAAGVTYCIEPLARRQTNFINTLAATAARAIGYVRGILETLTWRG